MSEFNNGAALVGAFAPFEASGKIRTLLALEILNQWRFAIGKEFVDFGSGKRVACDGLE